MLKNGTILITGATSGFGRATALLLAKRWPEASFILTGRRQEKLNEIVNEIGPGRAKAACFDLRDRKAVETFSRSHDLSSVSVLINNAGLAAGMDSFQEASLDDFDQMIDTNVKGLVYITRFVLPHLIARGEGHIVNIGSVAGHQVYPKGHVYNATKFAVRALNEALRLDTLGKNIRVTSIDPGLAETEFSLVRFKGDAEKAKVPYTGIDALQADDIAECILWALERPRHVNIQEMLVMPTEQPGVRDIFRK